MPIIQFKGRTAVETYHHTVPHHVLELDPELSELSADEKPSLDGNLIIEGDNLTALKSLLPTHAGRIKCVYIDPPYNTGKEGWIYNDNLTQPQFKEWIGKVVGNDETDPTRHDKWCCMMYPRLQVLKELMRNDGVIFISIDDNEVHHLRMLMDEVFGSANSLGIICWKNVTDNNPTLINKDNEFILCYAKNVNILPQSWKSTFSEAKELLQNEYDRLKECLKDPAEIQVALRDFISDNAEIIGNLSRYKNVDEEGIYTGSESVHNPKPGGYDFEIHHPQTGKAMRKPANGYRFPEDTFRKMDADDEIIYGEDEKRIVKIKKYLTDFEDSLRSVIVMDGRLGSYDLKRIFGKEEKVFSNPKPVELIQYLISFAATKSDTILDCTAGSGTTAHAILELNKRDNGNRRFILIQQKYDSKGDEDQGVNICETITAERVRRVIRGYRTGSKKSTNQVAGLGGSFTYARLSDKPLLGEYRDLNPLPSFEEIARYIFFTETSQQLDTNAINQKSGFLGSYNGQSYYLLYQPDNEAGAGMDIKWLRDFASQDAQFKIVVYCEKIMIHRDDLRNWEKSNGKTVRPMQVPFHLK